MTTSIADMPREFKVTPELDVLDYNSTQNRILRTVKAIFKVLLLPITLIGLALNYHVVKNYIVPSTAKPGIDSDPDNIKITTCDGALIDGKIVQGPKNAKKWIVFSNPNGAVKDDLEPQLKKYAEDFKCNILSYNYRGVRGDESLPSSDAELIRDGCAAVAYLQSNNVEEIALLGHSLGGCVSLGIAEAHNKKGTKFGVIVDRTIASFSSIVDRAFACYLKPFANAFLSIMGWEMNNIERMKKLDSNQCRAIFHKMDWIGNLHKKRIMTNEDIEVQGHHDPHCASLYHFTAYGAIQRAVGDAFNFSRDSRRARG